MQLPIRRIDPDLPLPEYATEGAVGFDLYARERVTIPPRGHGLVPNNIIITVPEGYGLLILARSSTLRKKGLLVGNGVGLIDSDYHGPKDEIMTLMYNPGDREIVVERGERWSQALLVPAPRVTFVEESGEHAGSSRGGFGSTGEELLTGRA